MASLDDIFSTTFIVAMIYLFVIRPIILKRRKFKCLRCGQCCRLRVKLSKEDIKRLEAAGKKNFVEGKHWLKRINGYCQFLEIKNGMAKCTAYGARPKICRWWPVSKFSCDTRCRSYNGKWF